MKKIVVVALLVVLALGVFTGVASAQTSQQGIGFLHEYMEKALAEKLGLPVATIEAQSDAGKTLYQIALDNGIAQVDLPTFFQEVRTKAVQAALADGVITQSQADRMLQMGARGMGFGDQGMGAGMMRGGTGTGAGSCGGMGIPVGTGMQRGGRWQK